MDTDTYIQNRSKLYNNVDPWLVVILRFINFVRNNAKDSNRISRFFSPRLNIKPVSLSLSQWVNTYVQQLILG